MLYFPSCTIQSHLPKHKSFIESIHHFNDKNKYQRITSHTSILHSSSLQWHLPQHTCHLLCHRPSVNRPDRLRPLIGQFKPDIQQYLAEEPLNNTRYNSAISSIHRDAVRTVIESSSSKLLNGRPPPISAAKQTLPRKTRTILAQLRIGHSRILSQYMTRIDLTGRNHCHNCGHFLMTPTTFLNALQSRPH